MNRHLFILLLLCAISFVCGLAAVIDYHLMDAKGEGAITATISLTCLTILSILLLCGP